MAKPAPSEVRRLQLGKAHVRARYRRVLDAVATPGATIGHHDAIDYPDDPLDIFKRALRKEPAV